MSNVEKFKKLVSDENLVLLIRSYSHEESVTHGAYTDVDLFLKDCLKSKSDWRMPEEEYWWYHTRAVCYIVGSNQYEDDNTEMIISKSFAVMLHKTEIEDNICNYLSDAVFNSAESVAAALIAEYEKYKKNPSEGGWF